MLFQFSGQTQKTDVFEKMESYLTSFVRIRNVDQTRPWGGFFVIEEADAEKFIQKYFPQFSKEELSISGKLSPKILVLAPGKRLSWQYHHRRAEIWKMVYGEAKIITSDSDIPSSKKRFSNNNIIELKQGERHRLEGLDNWAIIAEIWRHTDASNPSDEEDIIRIEDDFGR